MHNRACHCLISLPRFLHFRKYVITYVSNLCVYFMIITIYYQINDFNNDTKLIAYLLSAKKRTYSFLFILRKKKRTYSNEKENKEKKKKKEINLIERFKTNQRITGYMIAYFGIEKLKCYFIESNYRKVRLLITIVVPLVACNIGFKDVFERHF